MISVISCLSVVLFLSGSNRSCLGFEGLQTEIETEVLCKMVMEERAFIQEMLLCNNPNSKGSFCWANNEGEVLFKKDKDLYAISTDVKVRFCYPKTYRRTYINETLFSGINYSDEKKDAFDTTLNISRVLSSTDGDEELHAFVEITVISRKKDYIPCRGIMFISKYDFKQDKWLIVDNKILLLYMKTDENQGQLPEG